MPPEAGTRGPSRLEGRPCNLTGECIWSLGQGRRTCFFCKMDLNPLHAPRMNSHGLFSPLFPFLSYSAIKTVRSLTLVFYCTCIHSFIHSWPNKHLRSLHNGSDSVQGTGYMGVSKIAKVLALLGEGEKQMSTKKYVMRNSEKGYKGREQKRARWAGGAVSWKGSRWFRAGLRPFLLGTERCLEHNKLGGESHVAQLKQKAGGTRSHSTFQNMDLNPRATRGSLGVLGKNVTCSY